MGAIDNNNLRYRDSFEVKTGRVTLTRDWSLYPIDLTHADLRSLIGGFC